MSQRHLPVAPPAEPSPLGVATREEPSRPVTATREEPSRPVTATRDEELLQVGELAKASGKTVRAIHLYEELGLLRAHERSKGRYRLFTQEALLRVRWIAKLQHLGFSLSEIQGLVREQDGSRSAPIAAQKLHELYLAKLEETRQKLGELRELEVELQQSLAFLSTCDTACESAVPVHACPTCERHQSRPQPPELVLGVHAT